MSSISSLEADIAARRARLADTIDELARRATPQAIVDRQVSAAKARFTAATTDESGAARPEAMAAAALAALAVVALLVWRRKRA
jgi:MYXO-CTERM domain-containing protein